MWGIGGILMNNLEPVDIIKKALTTNQSALNEYDSKRFLSCFGIPINREVLAHSADEAAAEASKIGFPVVLKASEKRANTS
jgi:acyl-CoA synthetase (NDP forming)